MELGLLGTDYMADFTRQLADADLADADLADFTQQLADAIVPCYCTDPCDCTYKKDWRISLLLYGSLRSYI